MAHSSGAVAKRTQPPWRSRVRWQDSNALYGAARAAKLAGQNAQAASYYAALLRVTDGGANSSRPEVARARGEASGGK